MSKTLNENNSNELVDLLNKSGYKTVVGAEHVKSEIKRVSNKNKVVLCSGYGVFPDGNKCNGCSDCNSN